MAKGARASTKKANNSKLKSNIFGPVESARTARLSAKLLELASQPKPKPVKEDVVMEVQESGEGPSEDTNVVPVAELKQTAEVELDQETRKTIGRSKASGKGRIEKRRSSRKASIVFPKYKKRTSGLKSKK